MPYLLKLHVLYVTSNSLMSYNTCYDYTINLLPWTPYTGQHWNREVSVTPFTGVDRNGNPAPNRYVINLSSPISGEERSFTGYFTWDFEDGPCLYAGNRQAGPIYEIQEPKDLVIEGRYNEYVVDSAFSEDIYAYGMFRENMCV